MSQTSSIAKYLIGALVFVVLGYIGYATHTLWRGPIFVYLEPRDWTEVATDVTTIEGHARRAESIMINGFEATQDLEGYFAEEYALFPGENMFAVTITDKFGKTRTKTIHIVKTN